MYEVIKMFTDLQDNNFRYEVGDEYPRLGYETSISRIKELSSKFNKQGTPLIKKIEEDKVLDKIDKPKKRKTKKKN